MTWLRLFLVLLGSSQICAIALDIVSENPAHNLLCPKTLSFILDCIYSRRARALTAGPPCETWSQVRERILANGGCQVLRSCLQPWGVDFLKPKQLDQLHVASELLLTTLVLSTAMLMAGGTVILEHPAEPPTAHACSIWKLPVMKRLVQAPCATIERVRQGPLGQSSPKPTDLLCIRAPHVQRCVRLLSLPSRHVEAAPQFLPDGTFGTAPLKEYPPRFSGVILMSIWTSARDPETYKHDFRTAIDVVASRCNDVDNGTCTGPTPRDNIVPYPSMRFLSEWPVDCPAKFGPDFNKEAARVIENASRGCASRHEFSLKARDFVNSDAFHIGA